MRTASRLLALALPCLLPLTAAAQMTGNVIKIGVLNDQSGLYADLGGQGSVVAAKMAAEEFGGKVNGVPIEVIGADHQNKPDIGSGIATKWYDVDGVDVIVDVPNSGVALAVAKVTADKNKVFIDSGAATSDLTGKNCTPNTVHWTYDTWSLANAGGDTINSIKAASEFGIVQAGQKLAGLLVFITDVHALGLKAANGLQLTESFYWDHDDKTRAWSKKFAARHNNKMPSMVQAGVYAGVLHYLKAVQALKADGDGKAVVEKMKAMPTDDPLFGKGTIRADGRKIHPMYLYEVKKPSESKGPWDYYKLIKEIPAAEAFRPLSTSECPLVKK